MWYFVVISLKANLFFFRENVTIFLNHIILVPPTQKFVVFPFSKITLEICYETRFWKLPTNLSNDFEWSLSNSKFSSDKQFTNPHICNFFLHDSLIFSVSFFVEKFYLFSKSVIPSQQTINSFCKELCEEKKNFFLKYCSKIQQWHRALKKFKQKLLFEWMLNFQSYLYS